MSYISNPGAGGGGSGTVNAGTANQIAIYPASAAAVSGDSLLTDDGTTHTYTGTGGILSTTAGGIKAGANGGAAGVLTLNGSTSGAATFTAPAAAGTTSNVVTSTNYLALPGFSFVNPVTIPGSFTGIANNAAQNIGVWSNNSQWLFGNQNIVRTGKPFHPDGIAVAAGSNLFFVTSNFTTAANTNLQTITGLQFTHPSSNALNWNFHAVLVYSQATANAAVAFGIQAATNAPTNIFATGTQQITVGPPATIVTGTLATLTTTTATAIVSGTPGATGTNYTVYLDGTLELAASANTINFMVSTATSGDAVTVLRGSYVNIW